MDYELRMEYTADETIIMSILRQRPGDRQIQIKRRYGLECWVYE